jgi:hypothetical protein
MLGVFFSVILRRRSLFLRYFDAPACKTSCILQDAARGALSTTRERSTPPLSIERNAWQSWAFAGEPRGAGHFRAEHCARVINRVADAHVPRHCERSEAIQLCAVNSGLLRRLAPRNDEAVKSVRTFNECVSARPSRRVFFMQRAGAAVAGNSPGCSNAWRVLSCYFAPSELFLEIFQCPRLQNFLDFTGTRRAGRFRRRRIESAQCFTGSDAAGRPTSEIR